MKCLVRANMIRPVGNGVICGATLCPSSETIAPSRPPIIPYPTRRARSLAFSRHFVPGYLHIVPSGQLAKPLRFVLPFILGSQ
jgi:hypothetical protein